MDCPLVTSNFKLESLLIFRISLADRAVSTNSNAAEVPISKKIQIRPNHAPSSCFFQVYYIEEKY